MSEPKHGRWTPDLVNVDGLSPYANMCELPDGDYVQHDDYEAATAALTASDAQSAALQARLKLVEERARQAEELLREYTREEQGCDCEGCAPLNAFLAASDATVGSLQPRQGAQSDAGGES